MKNINIIGCGLMGSQIASLFSIMGYKVNIWNRTKIDKITLLRQKKNYFKIIESTRFQWKNKYCRKF